jgi:hypothetical protein
LLEKRYEKMADNKERKVGKGNKDVEELRWAAQMLREHAASDRELSKVIRRSNYDEGDKV